MAQGLRELAMDGEKALFRLAMCLLHRCMSCKFCNKKEVKNPCETMTTPKPVYFAFAEPTLTCAA
jgi:hypothetical protein